jgi:hypothetical protein
MAEIAKPFQLANFSSNVISYDSYDTFQEAVTAAAGKMLLIPAGIEVEVATLTLPTEITFIGGGTITGPAPTGGKPTETELISAGSDSARGILLDSYYNAEIETSATCMVYGDVVLKNCLLSGPADSFIVEGNVKLENVAFKGIGLLARSGGYIDSTDGLIIVDSDSDGIMCQYGGTVRAPSPVVLYSAGRGAHIQFGGTIFANAGSFRYSTQEGAFINSGGTFSCALGKVSNNSAAGSLINYGGSMNLYQAEVKDNGQAGIVGESNGAIYAVEAVITGNTTTGIDASYDGVVQATGATITGNGGQAVRVRTGGVVNILEATIDRTNNSGAAPLIWVQGRGVVYSEDNTGTGKTALNEDDYSPLHDEQSGIAWIGDWTTKEKTGSRKHYYAYNTRAEDAVVISSGEITIVGGYVSVDTESSASSDDLDTINGGQNLQRVILTAVDSARTVVVKHGTGNIYLDGGADFSLDHIRDKVELIKEFGVWVELSRSTNS